MDLERVRCAEHSQKVCELYCTDCDEIMCIICLATKHRQHTAVHIKQIIETEKKNLSKRLVSMEANLANFKTSLSRREVHHENYRQSVESSKVQLAQQIQLAKSELDDIHHHMLQQLSKSMENEDQQYSTDRKNIENEIFKLEKMIESTKTNLSKEKITTLLSCSRDLQKGLGDLNKDVFNEGNLKIPSFVQGNIQRAAYIKSIGQVNHPTYLKGKHYDDVDNVKIASPTVSASFKSPKNSPVRAICPVNSKEAWIVQNQEKSLILLNRNGNVSKIIPLSFLPDDMTMTDSGMLHLTTFNGCNVHTVSQNGNVNTMADFNPDCTRGICMTKEQCVLVCIISQDADRNSQIVRLSGTGSVLQKIEYMNTASPMFYWPSRVECQATGEIVILDWELGNNKSIILDTTGNYVSTWRGEVGSRIPRQFSPCGVACYHGGLIFITDRKNDQVYLLKDNGKSADYLMKVKDPFGMSIDVDMNLWIGCGDGSIHVVTLDSRKSMIDVTHF